MSVTFRAGWNIAHVAHPNDQAFLNLFTENDVLYAIGNAYQRGMGNGNIRNMLAAACEVGGQNVEIVKGPHEVEDMDDGYCLHLTARYGGHSYHLYLEQDGMGRLKVFEITP